MSASVVDLPHPVGPTTAQNSPSPTAMSRSRSAVYAVPEPSRAIQPIAEAIRKSEAASFVVVANVDGIRYSHPNPDLIGQRVSTDPSPALQGQSWVGIEQGTLGKSVRAKVPIFESGGKVIGIVSVGFLEDQVNATLLQSML